ncbi:hypothetical protein ABT124_17920 [Streptomyces sp. NPDC001982]
MGPTELGSLPRERFYQAVIHIRRYEAAQAAAAAQAQEAEGG